MKSVNDLPKKKKVKLLVNRIPFFQRNREPISNYEKGTGRDPDFKRNRRITFRFILPERLKRLVKTFVVE